MLNLPRAAVMANPWFGRCSLLCVVYVSSNSNSAADQAIAKPVVATAQVSKFLALALSHKSG